jgi:hypothetical protein
MEVSMLARAGLALLVILAAPFAACGGDDGGGSGSKPKATGVQTRAARFASCARKSDYKVVRPEPPNERADFLHEEGFTFAEVDLEEPPVLFFTAIADFFPSRADATRAREQIASSLAGPSTVQKGSVVVHYTDDPGTPKRTKAEGVVNDCLRQ